MSDEFDLNVASPFADPLGAAILKQTPSDFIVDEVLEVTDDQPSQGEHLYLHVEKISQNTHWVAKQIANVFSLKERDIGYCGLKDRHAMTSQWFSVYLPKPPQDIAACIAQISQNEQTRVLSWHFGQKKLRRGIHQGNQFKITLRDCQLDPAALADRIYKIQQSGVPNYFGLQRFGRSGNNLIMARQMWEEGRRIGVKSQKQMAISAARSHLFNRVLNTRVQQGNWSAQIEGDITDDAGKPTGPLWGRGRLATSAQALALETQTLETWQAWCHGLEHCGVNQERRSLVCMPTGLSAEFANDTLVLQFFLPPGQYATTVIEAIVSTTEPSRD